VSLLRVAILTAWVLGFVFAQTAPNQSVGGLILQLGSQQSQARIAAADALRSMGADARDAVPALITGLQEDKETDLRDAAVRALREIGPDAKDAIPSLIKVLREDKETLVREDAAAALGDIGPNSKKGAAALVACSSLPSIRRSPRCSGPPSSATPWLGACPLRMATVARPSE